ncbi:MAG: tyrosine--tRNA ligase [Gammaproteobacteria bacterium]|nr:tyrosine--tRNA ligase [Gammaproteobacteria bacterium]
MSRAALDALDARGLIAQISDRAGLAEHLGSGSRTIYCGFDPTAPSLHIGNLVPLLTLRRLQLLGHRPIALVGGATGLIGDPSFRADERALNERDVVEAWVTRIREQVSGLVDLDGNNAALVVNNLDWTAELDVISYLRTVGKHFSVNAMIQRDSVRSRLERDDAGISYTEFSYMLLQSYDFLELARRYDCTVQVGGSDQWGNIVSGMDLTRKVLHKDAYAMTVPLVTKADGTKFGKTAGGSIWLDPALTPPYGFYQFWLNAADADAVPFLRYFTFVSDEEIDALAVEMAQRPETRAAQRTLAREATQLVHGNAALVSAERITAALFSGDVKKLTVEDLEQLRVDGMECTGIGDDAGLLAVMADGGMARSRGEARKLVQSGAVRLNGEIVDDVERQLVANDALFGRYYLIRRGKKNWHLVVRDRAEKPSGSGRERGPRPARKDSRE